MFLVGHRIDSGYQSRFHEYNSTTRALPHFQQSEHQHIVDLAKANLLLAHLMRPQRSEIEV